MFLVSMCLGIKCWCAEWEIVEKIIGGLDCKIIFAEVRSFSFEVDLLQFKLI